MTSVRRLVSVAACVIWALAVFAGVEIQAAWRRVRGLPDLDERFA